MILSRDRKDRLATAYGRYADMLYRLALSHTGRREDAEDAVQDVFTKYIASSKDFEDEQHERAWFVRVTINRCHDLVRRSKIRTHDSLDDILEVADEENPASGILKTLAEIPETYRTAITLHHLEGFSVEETARMLGLSLSACKMRLSRGRELLKKTIIDEEKNDV